MLRTALCVSPGTCEPSRKGTMQASPRQRLRAPLILALAGLSLVGYAIFLALRSPSGHLASAREAAAQPPAAAVIAQARAKLKHVVFVILENRSFDSVFGRYPGATGTTTGTLPGGSSYRCRMGRSPPGMTLTMIIPTPRAPLTAARWMAS